jgi:hypothetical protein
VARLSVMQFVHRLGAAAAMAGAMVLGIATSPTPAWASCVGSPAKSPDGFVGTVVRLGADHRQVFVEKDDGTQVEVDGGTINGGLSGEDFTFVLGGRYDIEPENSRPPFLVNDCTATTLLGMTSVPAAATSAAAATSPVRQSPATPTRVLVASAVLTTHKSWWPVLRDAAVILALIVLALVAIRRGIWRRRRSPGRT